MQIPNAYQNTQASRQSLQNLSILDQSQVIGYPEMYSLPTLPKSPSKGSHDFGLAQSPSRSLLSNRMSRQSGNGYSLSLSPLQGINFQQAPMKFGTSKQTNEERVLAQMLDNQSRDPEVNLKSILGRDELVLNLRPVDKSKHLGEKSHFTHKAHTEAQRMQDENLLYRQRHLPEDDQGLPPVNMKVGKMIKKTQKRPIEKKRFQQDSDDEEENDALEREDRQQIQDRSRNPGLTKNSSKQELVLGGSLINKKRLIPYNNLHQKVHFKTIEQLMIQSPGKAGQEMPAEENFKYAKIPGGKQNDNKSQVREHIRAENQNIKNIELKHMDIQNRNLLKKVLSDCNYTNTKKSARTRVVQDGSFDQNNSIMYSLLDASQSTYKEYQGGVRDSNTEMKGIIQSRQKMIKSPSGISLADHSILVRRMVKKNVTPLSPIFKSSSPSEKDGQFDNIKVIDLNKLTSATPQFSAKILQRGADFSLTEEKALRPSGSNISLRLEDVQRPTSIHKQINIAPRAPIQIKPTLLSEDNLHMLGARQIVMNDHSKLLKDYKDRKAQSPKRPSPFTYIALEDQKEGSNPIHDPPQKSSSLQKSQGYKGMDGNLYTSYMEYRRESLNKVSEMKEIHKRRQLAGVLGFGPEKNLEGQIVTGTGPTPVPKRIRNNFQSYSSYFDTNKKDLGPSINSTINQSKASLKS